MSKMTQSALMKLYNDTHRESFNETFFERNNEDIINELKNIIISNQRNQLFTIRVESFETITDYKEINDALCEYTANIYKNKKKKVTNPYEYVNLKDSDIYLLKVKYFISAKDLSEYLDVLIAVPIYVDKYHFRISGNYYSAMYQIVDASTYNNQTVTNTKNPCVTLKTTASPIRIFKVNDTISDIEDEVIKCNHYNISVFEKKFNVFKYILAKYGLIGTMRISRISCIEFYDKKPLYNDNVFLFEKHGIYIGIPKVIYNNDQTVQSLVVCILQSINKDTTLDSLFLDSHWIEYLGAEFSTSFTLLKGESVLKSIESVYDISIKESIRLPEDKKQDIYHILLWMMREFNHLKNKDNLDISTKRIRCAEYIASIYAMRLIQGIYRLSDLGKRVTIDQIKKSINIRPNYLLIHMVKCKLINYRNLVNDLDSLIAIKYTYKGISGIGDKGAKNVPVSIRYVHPSHIGRTDMDSSSKSDPGMSGVICPLTELYNNSFSDFTEPNFWDTEFDKLMVDYKKLVGRKELLTAKRVLLGDNNTVEDEDIVDDSLNTMKRLLRPVKTVLDTQVVARMSPSLEEGGMIYYE